MIVYSDNYKQYFRRNTHVEMRVDLKNEKEFNYKMASYWNEAFDLNERGLDMDVELNRARKLIDEVTVNGTVNPAELTKLQELQGFLSDEFKVDLEINKKENFIRVKGFYRKVDFKFVEEEQITPQAFSVNDRDVENSISSEPKTYDEMTKIAVAFAEAGLTEEEMKVLGKIRPTSGSDLKMNSKDIFVENQMTGEVTNVYYNNTTGKVETKVMKR